MMERIENMLVSVRRVGGGGGGGCGGASVRPQVTRGLFENSITAKLRHLVGSQGSVLV